MKRVISMGIMLMLANLVGAQNAADEFTGKVVSVVDGNTLEVKSNNNESYTILLMGIDSPELNQEYGDKAKKLLEKLSLEKSVLVRLKGKDRKGLNIAEVFVNGDEDVRIALLKEGMAWTAERNPIPELEEHRIKAQQKGRGLWKQADPTPPWTFRRQQTMLQAKSSS